MPSTPSRRARAASDERIRHHDLCYGCGQANLFGLQMEASRTPAGTLEGRFFVKQDHQGPPGTAHGGILGLALDEAMALLVHAEGIRAVTRTLEIDLLAPAPAGTFVTLEARIERREGRRLWLSATASAEGATVAEGRGVFVAERAIA